MSACDLCAEAAGGRIGARVVFWLPVVVLRARLLAGDGVLGPDQCFLWVKRRPGWDPRRPGNLLSSAILSPPSCPRGRRLAKARASAGACRGPPGDGDVRARRGGRGPSARPSGSSTGPASTGPMAAPCGVGLVVILGGTGSASEAAPRRSEERNRRLVQGGARTITWVASPDGETLEGLHRAGGGSLGRAWRSPRQTGGSRTDRHPEDRAQWVERD